MKRTVRKRRMQAKTDYKARFALLKSEKPRIVVRKTNRYIIAQLVYSDIAQDKVVFGLTSSILLSKGWPETKKGSLKNIGASYLTGFVLGKKIVDKYPEAILDVGMNRNIQKSRIYAVLKGLIDSGVKIPCNEKSLPEDKEINKDEKLVSVFKKIKESA